MQSRSLTVPARATCSSPRTPNPGHRWPRLARRSAPDSRPGCSGRPAPPLTSALVRSGSDRTPPPSPRSVTAVAAVTAGTSGPATSFSEGGTSGCVSRDAHAEEEEPPSITKERAPAPPPLASAYECERRTLVPPLLARSPSH